MMKSAIIGWLETSLLRVSPLPRVFLRPVNALALYVGKVAIGDAIPA
jgi:hypothetical protein